MLKRFLVLIVLLVVQALSTAPVQADHDGT